MAQAPHHAELDHQIVHERIRLERQQSAAAFIERVRRDDVPARVAANFETALRDGNVAAIEGLIADGLNADAALESGTLLERAIGEVQLEVIDVLLAHGARPSSASLCFAVQERFLAVITRLLDAGAPVNGQLPDGRGALHIALEHPIDDDVARQIEKRLLDAGADAELRDLHGRTPAEAAHPRRRAKID